MSVSPKRTHNEQRAKHELFQHRRDIHSKNIGIGSGMDAPTLTNMVRNVHQEGSQS